MKALITIAILCIATLSLCLGDEEKEKPKLKIEVTFKPDSCDKKSKKGDQLKMHYTGTLEKDGSKFDSSHDRKEPFEFQLGVGHVIRGWDEGLEDMCIGEKRKLLVPAHLGYGEQGAGEKIPGGSNLVFETELLEITEGAPVKNIFKEIDSDDDGKLGQEEISLFLKQQVAEARNNEPTDDKADKKTEQEKDKEHNEMVSDIFNHEDKDKDGFISWEEFSGPKHDEL